MSRPHTNRFDAYEKTASQKGRRIMAINPYESVLRQLEQKNAQDIATAQQGAGTQAQESYINYMNSLKNLNQGLRSQGITGGGSESALLGANVGYQRQKNLVAGNLAQNLQGLSQNYMANRSAVETQRADWEAQRQAKEEERFANTLTGFNTIPAVDNAIQAAQTAGETWKIGYLMAQRAALQEQASALVSGGGGTTTETTGGGGTTLMGSASPQYSAPLALSTPAYIRPIVANAYNPTTSSVPTPNKNPYYR